MECNKNWQPAVAALLLGLCIFAGFYSYGRQVADSRNGGLTVTGSVKKNVSSDLAKWTAGFSRRADLSNLKSILEQSEADVGKVKNFIKGYGITDAQIIFLPVQTDAVYEQLPGYGYTQNVIGYNVRQEMHVQGSDIDTMEKLANESKKLIDRGIVLDFQRTEYFYTKINELRPQLFADATKDAKQRADAIASGTGVKVGELMSARTGVIQITQPNSTDFSDYGTYDLSTREKEISATVSVTFRLSK
jgi:uncharacterized protein